MIEQALLIGITALLAVGQLGRIELMGGLINGYWFEVLMGVFALWYALHHRKTLFKPTQVTRAATVFIGWLLVSFFIPFHAFTLVQNGIAFLYLARLVLYTLFTIAVMSWVQKAEGNRAFVRSLLFTFTILLLLISAAQYVLVHDLWSMYPYGWDPHELRIFGAYLDVFVPAAFFGLLAIYWFTQKNYALVAVLSIELVLTFSRSAYLALALVVFITVLATRKWHYLAFFVIAFVLMVALAPKQAGEGVNLMRTSTIQSRLHDTALGLQIVASNSITGVGYNHIRYVKEQMGLLRLDDYSHSAAAFSSSYLIILVSSGIIGLLLFANLYWRIFALKGMAPYGIYLGVMALFDNVLLYGMIAVVVVLLFAVNYPWSSSQ